MHTKSRSSLKRKCPIVGTIRRCGQYAIGTLTILMLTVTTALAQSVLYVDADSTGPVHDGTTWCCAYLHLQDALAVASASGGTVTEIRVAEGVYKPDEGSGITPGDRYAAFQLINGVILRGGYAGCGAHDPDKRDISQHETILSGDLNGDDATPSDPADILDEPTRAENSYHVFFHPEGLGLKDTAVMDGFTVTGGNAKLRCLENLGGGMYNSGSHPTVIHCTFSDNLAEWGGAMFNDHAHPKVANCVFTGNIVRYGGGAMYNQLDSAPTVTKCNFSRNSAADYYGVGGGMMNYLSNPAVTDCAFSENEAECGGAMSNERSNTTIADCLFRENRAFVGGAIYNQHSSPLLMNCAFSGNSAVHQGGGTYDYFYSDPTLRSCTFSGNSAGKDGGGICTRRRSSAVLTNCILWGDMPNEIAGEGSSTVTHSDVQGGTGKTWFGEASIDADPMFVDPGHWNDNGTPDDPIDDFWVNGDYRLQAGSPCIDAGDNTAVPVDVLTDLAGKPRLVNDPLVLDTGYGGRPIVDMGAYEHQVVLLDIMPGWCPNRLNTRSNARVRIAVVGTDVFDVSSIDMDSLMLQRADGVGGTVEPLRHGWRPMVFQQDVVTPFDGDLCDCHRMRRDSVDDLVVRFSTRDIVRELELRGISHKMPMPLTLHGLLLDGTPFEASDCILTTGRWPSGRERGISTGDKD